MDNCKRCKKENIFDAPIKEINGILGRCLDTDFLVHVKTSHGIEPEMFIGLMNSVVANYDSKIKTKLFNTKEKKFIPAKRSDWVKNL